MKYGLYHALPDGRHSLSIYQRSLWRLSPKSPRLWTSALFLLTGSKLFCASCLGSLFSVSAAARNCGKQKRIRGIARPSYLFHFTVTPCCKRYFLVFNETTFILIYYIRALISKINCIYNIYIYKYPFGARKNVIWTYARYSFF